MVKKGQDPNLGNAIGQRALHIACLHGCLEAIKALLECGADANVQNDRGGTPLHFAANAKAHAAEAVRLLLAAGADPQVADYGGSIPSDGAMDDEVRKLLGAPSLALHVAASEGELEEVMKLLSEGLPVDVADPCQRTPLHCAAEEGHTAVVVALLAAGASAKSCDSSGYTPLHAAVASSADAALLRALVAAGADVNARTTERPDVRSGDEPPPCASALHFAVGLRLPDAVQALLEAGADVDAEDGNGVRPLAVALEQGDAALTNLLLARGARTDVPVGMAKNAVLWAVQKDDAGLLRALRAAGADLSAAAEGGMTPLHLAARSGRMEALAVLLEAAPSAAALGATMNPGGATPLHLAALNKRPLAVQALLAAGADKNAKNGNQETPLAVAKCDACRELLR